MLATIDITEAALISAAQTGQLLIGPYLTQPVATMLVAMDFATFMTEPADVGASVIGIRLTAAGTAKARSLRRAIAGE